jgi:hypothetical protein
VRYPALGGILVPYRGDVQRISYTFCRKFLVHWCRILATAAGWQSASRWMCRIARVVVTGCSWHARCKSRRGHTDLTAAPKSEGGMIMKARTTVFVIGIAEQDLKRRLM